MNYYAAFILKKDFLFYKSLYHLLVKNLKKAVK